MEAVGDGAREAVEASSSARQRILDATLSLLAREGLAGVSIRAVARQAEVAVGLTNYHFTNKIQLICAALEQIGELDMELVAPRDGVTPADQLRASLSNALDASYLTQEYLGLRLQLWSLAGVDELFAEINRKAQERYLAGLADLLAAARPELERSEVERRAADILIVQNGVWLTAILISDDDAVDRARRSCHQLAFD